MGGGGVSGGGGMREIEGFGNDKGVIGGLRDGELGLDFSVVRF